MAEYQRIEYRIGKDGRVIETVIDGVGSGCVPTTAEIETALGTIESRQLLPEYDQDTDVTTETIQTVNQG
jgi:hypothetical protein